MTTWQGRSGSIALGPTEDRAARYLADLCRHGRIRIRTVDLAARLGLERSEAYRILARLRVLGLFGVSSDRGGHAGGRHVWRTAARHEGDRLDPTRHRVAWARVRGAAMRARARVHNRLAEIRPGAPTGPVQAPAAPLPAPGRTFAQAMRAAGLGGLMDSWGLT